MKNYRAAFIATTIASLILAAGLAYVGWKYVWHRAVAPEASPQSAAAATSESASPVASPGSSGKAAQQQIPLAPLQLTPQRLQSIGVKTGAVESMPAFDEIRTVGNVAVDERLESYIQLRFSGWIRKVFVNTTYQYVRRGQPLFTIYSPDLVTTEQEYLLARKNSNLLVQSTVPGVASGAASLLGAAAERLRQWEIPAREVARLESTGKSRDYLEIDSPVSGYVTERNALPNMYVQPQTRLYTVADLSTVWVYAEVFQNEVGEIKAGDPAALTVDTYPGRTFRGRVDFVYPQVDMTTRTVKVRFVFQNPGLKLTPGMYVNVHLKIPLGRRLIIPAAGVFHTGTRNIVFINHGGGNLEPRDVVLGPQANEGYVVLKGLKAGESVVTSANFLIDSESQLQAAIGSFVPPPPGAGAAASMNTPSAAATIQFSTTPSPAHKGNNSVQVRLALKGKPVTGAQVTVTFFMPAMPAMGMPSMRTVMKLNDKGGGVYQGSGQLQSGGTWQVTVFAQKNGQTVASKQLTVNAEGGM